MVSKVDTNLIVYGTEGGDEFGVDLSNGVRLDLGNIEYQFASSAVRNVDIKLAGGADTLTIQGNQSAETVNMYSSNGSLSSAVVNVTWNGSEKVCFDGHSGPDRVYAFDTDGNDQLTIHPNRFQLDGAGYQFIVTRAERLYVDASRGGNDQAYMFDSDGDDTLSIRPQFCSIRGAGYFNYVTGFERVYAYATSSGFDTAMLYDSKGNDNFATNGDSASIVGNGYYSYTRFFESVESVSSAGGTDRAAIFSPESATNYVGSDFIAFKHQQWSRTARGFANVQTSIVASSSVSTKALEADQFALPPVTTIDQVAIQSQVELSSESGAGNEFQHLTNPDEMTSSLEQYPTAVSNIMPVEVSKLTGINFAVVTQHTADDTTEIIERPNQQNASVSPHRDEQKLSLDDWIAEDADQLYALQRIDPMTLSLLDEEREKLSLLLFFDSLDQG